MTAAITIRRSTDADEAAIRRLAALDDRPAPRGAAMLAFVDDELRAALPLGRGAVVADPFQLTDGLVRVLVEARREPAVG